MGEGSRERENGYFVGKSPALQRLLERKDQQHKEIQMRPKHWYHNMTLIINNGTQDGSQHFNVAEDVHFIENCDNQFNSPFRNGNFFLSLGRNRDKFITKKLYDNICNLHV